MSSETKDTEKYNETPLKLFSIVFIVGLAIVFGVDVALEKFTGKSRVADEAFMSKHLKESESKDCIISELEDFFNENETLLLREQLIEFRTTCEVQHRLDKQRDDFENIVLRLR